MRHYGYDFPTTPRERVQGILNQVPWWNIFWISSFGFLLICVALEASRSAELSRSMHPPHADGYYTELLNTSDGDFIIIHRDNKSGMAAVRLESCK